MGHHLKMLNILSHSTHIYSRECWKYWLRRLLKVERGPDAVRHSLFRGLNELGTPYCYQTLGDRVLVLSGVGALKEALEAKKNGTTSFIAAGPNIVIHPDEHGKILCDALIDKVIVPSSWVKDFYISMAPELATKIVVWPAGVAASHASSKQGHPLIYDKLNNPELLREVMKMVPEARVIAYGKFSRSQYLRLLEDVPYMIYLAESESQGLALQEAWARNVPTIVNTSNSWRKGTLSWQASQINAPYLTSEAGTFFEKPADIPRLVSEVAKLKPKVYCDRELSDSVSAAKLIKLI